MSQILLSLLKASIVVRNCCFPSFSRAKQWLFSIRWRLDFTIRPRRGNRRPDCFLLWSILKWFQYRCSNIVRQLRSRKKARRDVKRRLGGVFSSNGKVPRPAEHIRNLFWYNDLDHRQLSVFSSFSCCLATTPGIRMMCLGFHKVDLYLDAAVSV